MNTMKRTLNYAALAMLAAAIFSSCAKQGENTGATDTTAAVSANANQSNIDATKGFYENVMNKHDTAAADKYCTADFVDHNPAPGHTGKGMADLKAELAGFFTMFPDLHFTISDISADGNRVWLRYTFTGTMKGAMGKMPANNKSVTVGGIDEIQLQNGKATDRWGYEDDMAMMQQMGMMPAPPSGGSMQKK